MREILILILFITLTEAFANLQMPSGEEIEKQKENITNVLTKASALSSDEKFTKDLNKEKASLKDVKIAKNYDYKIPEGVYNSKTPTELQAFNLNSLENREEKLIPLIFVTLTMPNEELKHLFDEGNRVGAAIIVRGFFKDLKTTVAKFKELSIDNGFLIDPTLFKKYSVKQVPTFVLPIKKDVFVKASGSVSLEYFLNLVTRTGTKDEILIAKNLVKKL